MWLNHANNGVSIFVNNCFNDLLILVRMPGLSPVDHAAERLGWTRSRASAVVVAHVAVAVSGYLSVLRCSVCQASKPRASFTICLR